jgi:very-short-patch-repair endonuclease
MKKCDNCDNLHDSKIGSGRFCSPKCSKSFSTKGKRKEINEKISHSLKGRIIKEDPILLRNRVKDNCKFCKLEYEKKKKNQKYCSRICSSRDCTELSKEKIKNKYKERIEKGEHKGWQTRNIESYPEKFFKSVLQNLNIKYDFNLPVNKKSLGLDESSCYFLDFYIEINNRKIDLEIDGKQHDYKERKEKDKIRDSILSKNNYEIYRIKWKNPINEDNKSYIKTEIEKLKEYLDII